MSEFYGILYLLASIFDKEKLKVGDIEKGDLGLSQAIQQYKYRFEFVCQSVFLSREYFEAKCCKRVSELDWNWIQFKKYRSGAGVQKCAVEGKMPYANDKPNILGTPKLACELVFTTIIF